MGGEKKRKRNKSEPVMVKIDKLLAEAQGFLDSGKMKIVDERYDSKMDKTVIVFEVSRKKGISLIEKNSAVLCAE